MSTREILTKLKNKSRLLPGLGDLKVHLEALDYVFTVAGVVMKTKSLTEEGIGASFNELLLPHVVTTFGPPLIANSIRQRFIPTPRGLLTYAIAFVFSLFVHSNSFLMFFIREIPQISRFFSLVKLKNTDEDTFTAFVWAITAELAGQFVTKLVLKKGYKVKPSEVVKIVATYTGILLLRRYKMPDYTVIVVASVLPQAFKLAEYLKSKRPKKAITSERRPTRKASVVSAAAKNK